MTTLITGAGLIGSHAARQLLDSGTDVVLYDLQPNVPYLTRVLGRAPTAVAADLRDLPALLDTVRRYAVDTIVHTAGLIGSRVAEQSYTGVTNNLLGTINVLEAARLQGLRRVVYVSTFGVYDRPHLPDGPVAETAPTAAYALYGATKLASEHLVHAYAGQYELDTVIIRPAGVFGFGHYVGGSSVGKAMRDLATAILRGGAVTVDAQRLGVNEYVYAKDVGLAICLACQAAQPVQRVYNAGSGVVTTPAELADVVRQTAPGVAVTLTHGDAEAPRSRNPLDLRASAAEIGYTPQYPLAAALADYVQALRAAA